MVGRALSADHRTKTEGVQGGGALALPFEHQIVVVRRYWSEPLAIGTKPATDDVLTV